MRTMKTKIKELKQKWEIDVIKQELDLMRNWIVNTEDWKMTMFEAFNKLKPAERFPLDFIKEEDVDRAIKDREFFIQKYNEWRKQQDCNCDCDIAFR